ncbi:MAG: NADP-dependent oxidoreductase [Spirochaetaceae bacterium]
MFSRKTRKPSAPVDGRMDAVVIHRFGGPEVLECTTVERPTPRLHDVIIRVRAVGISPLDWKTRTGEGLWDRGRRFPAVLGWDVSGTVAERGRLVGEFEEGDDVFGLANYPVGGAYAEYVRVPMEQLVAKPQAVSHAEAAAVPLVGLAAYQALFEVGRLSQGKRVLIHGAAGGVGHIAVQLAKSCGAHVVGTASGRNLEFVRALGADEVINYATTPFERGTAPVDLVLDTVGGEVTERSHDVLSRHGVIVTLNGGFQRKGVGARRVLTLSLKPDQATLRKLANLLADGVVRTSVTTVSGLRAVSDAHRISETGHVRGKVVVTV